MTMIDPGTYGAKRQSWKKENPRDLLKQILDENPRASEEKIMRLFESAVRNNEIYFEAILEYWFANNYRSLVHKLPTVHENIAKKSAATKRANSAKKMVLSAVTKIVLLDMILPNGKHLRDATGADCTKAGGWFTRIASVVKPSQRVGEILSENEIQKLYK